MNAMELVENVNGTYDAAYAADHVQYAAYDVVLQTIIVFGICGNVINLLVLSRPTLRSVTYTYLFWLAISDLAYLLVAWTVYVVEWFDHEVIFTYNVMFAMCHLTFALSTTFATSSAFIVTVLTVDRHRAVCHPLRCKDKLGRRRAFATIFCSFAVAAIINVPIVFQTFVEKFDANYDDDDHNHNSSSSNSSEGIANEDTSILYQCRVSGLTDELAFKVYVFVREAVGRVVPVILVTVLNVRIILALRKCQKERRDLSCSVDKARAVEERRLVHLLIAIVVMFLVCTTPQMISWIVASKDAIEHSHDYDKFDSASELLAAFNAANNFYLYCFCSKAVRQTCLDAMKSLGRPFNRLNDLISLLSSSVSETSFRRNLSAKQTSTAQTAVSQ